jgi:hypothetical protein
MCLIECAVQCVEIGMRPGVEKRHEPRDVEFNSLIEVYRSFHELLLWRNSDQEAKECQASQ